jgi:hypothetical protein
MYSARDVPLNTNFLANTMVNGVPVLLAKYTFPIMTM